MNLYTWRGHTYRAWSEGIQCNKATGLRCEKEAHYPHAFNPDYASHGPYMCWGYPSYRDEPTEQVTVTRDEAIETLSRMYVQSLSGRPDGIWHARAVFRALGAPEATIDEALPRPQPKHRLEGAPTR